MIGNKVYGSMVLGLPDDGTAVKRALAFLSGYENIIAEEVTENEEGIFASEALKEAFLILRVRFRLLFGRHFMLRLFLPFLR